MKLGAIFLVAGASADERKKKPKWTIEKLDPYPNCKVSLLLCSDMQRPKISTYLS